MTEPIDVIDDCHRILTQYPNVLNVAVGEQFKGGVRTGRQVVVVYVSEKKPLAALAPAEVIPRECDGVAVDVQELKATDFKVGVTSVSRLPPSAQRRLLGVHRP